MCDPLVLAAGSDVSHWFDPATREVRRHPALLICQYSLKHTMTQRLIASKHTAPPDVTYTSPHLSLIQAGTQAPTSSPGGETPTSTWLVI